MISLQGMADESLFQINSYFFPPSSRDRNCFLCWDRWNGDVTPKLDAARCVALGRVLIWVMSPDWVEELYIARRDVNLTLDKPQR